MKKFTRLKLAVATLSLGFLGACSPTMYTFAPHTGGYHGQNQKTEVAKIETPATEIAPVISETATAATEAKPTVQVSAPVQAAAALSEQVQTTTASSAAQAVTGTDSKSNKLALKQLRQEMKQVTKEIKSGQGVKIDQTVKLLLVLGLIFLLLGYFNNFLGFIGAVLLIAGLVLLLLGTL